MRDPTKTNAKMPIDDSPNKARLHDASSAFLEVLIEHRLPLQSRVPNDPVNVQEQGGVPARKVVQEPGGKGSEVPFSGGLKVLVMMFLPVVNNLLHR
jgi:hypothetical protein